MMVVPVIALPDEFEPRGTVAKIKPLHHSHLLQQMHGAINRGQIAPAPGHGRKDFPIGHRVQVPAQDFQNGLARAGDFSGLPAETAG